MEARPSQRSDPRGTMVTAGVYMVARSTGFFFQMAPQAMGVVAVIGALYGAVCRIHCHCSKRYQAGACLFDRQPARL